LTPGTSHDADRPHGAFRATSGRPESVRLFVRWYALLSLPAIVASAISFGAALDRTGAASLSTRSVDWLHAHNYGDPISAATLGDVSDGPLDGSTAGTGTATTPPIVPASTSIVPVPATKGIAPIVTPPLPGEGQWQPIGDVTGGSTAMQVAKLRPDAAHGNLLAAVVRIDQSAAAFRIVPGLLEPGGATWSGGGAIDSADRPNVLAAFNSGFRLAEAKGGFYEGGRTEGQLRVGAASLMLAANGTLNVVKWGRDGTMATSPRAVRQNLDLIVDNGALVSGLDDNTANRWGKTVGDIPFVWRSGIGIDAMGRIIYVASDGLTVATLATLLQRAGAVRAMELDINYSWVSFNTFHHESTGQIHGKKLEDGMKKPGSRYLSPDPRDFVAVVARQPLAAG
jgi:hypothetical protein